MKPNDGDLEVQDNLLSASECITDISSRKSVRKRERRKRESEESGGERPQNKRYLQHKNKSVARIDSELLKSRRIKKKNQLNGKVIKSIVRCYHELALSTHQNSYH